MRPNALEESRWIGLSKMLSNVSSLYHIIQVGHAHPHSLGLWNLRDLNSRKQ